MGSFATCPAPQCPRTHVAVLVGLSLLLALVPPSPVIAQPADSAAAPDLTYAVGADLSYLRAAERQGMAFRDSGEVEPGLQIFREHGYDWIRLRLFHSPEKLPNDLQYTINLARAAQRRGYKFLLDYHYADSWADPNKQPIPEAWKGLSPEVLADSVFEYTRRTIRAFREAGVMPEMAQIGNEIRNGMLWPTGKLPDHWNQFATLVKAGIDGVDAGRGRAPRPLIMIHYDQGADPEGATAFYDKLASYNIRYDVIGLSYYPWWHGNLLHLRETLLSLVENYTKDIILVETAYNWRPSQYQDVPAPYPETPAGQREFLESVNRTLLSIPSRQIKGIFWWEPAMMKGPIYSRGMFDDDGDALPAIEVFDKYKHGVAGESNAPQ